MTLPTNQILSGDCLQSLKQLPDNSIDLITTDPPYGYSFMGKDWDTFNEVVEPKGAYQNKKGFKKLPRNKPNGMYEFMLPIWKECIRVLKPGAFAFVMCAPRQDVLCKQIMALTDAGFDMGFSSIYWSYSSGFPKAHNIGKTVDKKLGNKREVIGPKKLNPRDKKAYTPNKYDGYQGTSTFESNPDMFIETKGSSPLEGSYGGFQPKPAVEVIIVCMKPMEKKTFVEQALDNNKGITWMDDCRIPYQSEDDKLYENKQYGKYDNDIRMNASPIQRGYHNIGRFPANLLVSDDVLNDGIDKKSCIGPSCFNNTYHSKEGFRKNELKSVAFYGDKGSYSRYFDLDKWAEINNIKPENNTFPFLICPKASKKEKNKGCEGLEEKKLKRDWFCKCKKCDRYVWAAGNKDSLCKCEEPEIENGSLKNNHPTVKPLKLMSYLITLGSRPGDIVLDPFAGSGTTLVAAKNLNRNFIGCELSEEYIEIIKARLGSVEEPKPIKIVKEEKPVIKEEINITTFYE